MMKLVLALVALVATVGFAFGTPSVVGYTTETATVFMHLNDARHVAQYSEDEDEVAMQKVIDRCFEEGTAFFADAGMKVFETDYFFDVVGFDEVRFEGETEPVFVVVGGIAW